MDWSTVLAKLPDAVPALLGAFVGGCIALLAAAGAQYLSHSFTRTREAEKLGHEKAEELIQAMFALSDWVIAMYDALPHETSTLPLTPPNRIHTLQWLYFPELQEPFQELNQALIPCLELFRTQRRAQWADAHEWRKVYNPALFHPLHQDYVTAWNKALGAVVASTAVRSPSLRLMRRNSQQKKTI